MTDYSYSFQGPGNDGQAYHFENCHITLGAVLNSSQIESSWMTDYSYSFQGPGNDGLAQNLPGLSSQICRDCLHKISGDSTEGVEDTQRTEYSTSVCVTWENR